MLITIPSKASELLRFSWGKWLDSALCRSVYFTLLHFSYPSWLATYSEERGKPSIRKSPGKGTSITLPDWTAYTELLAHSVLIGCWSVLSLGTWPFNILKSLLLARWFQAIFSCATLHRQKASVRTSCHILFIIVNSKNYLLISDDVIGTEQDTDKHRAYPEEFIILKTNIDETTCTWKTLKWMLTY